MDLHLYGAVQSGHSYKVRLFLLLCGADHGYTAIDLTTPRDERPEPFRSLAPHGEVPLLVADGRVIAQSNAILLDLARQLRRYGGRDEAEWTAITAWLFWEANRIGRSYPNLRWYRRFDTSGDPGLVRWFHETAEADLDRLERALAHQPFLLGELTIADISCAGYLLYGDDVGLAMERWPHVLAWLERLRALPGFQPPLTAMAPPGSAVDR
jgi:glutathione S-transferase